MARRVLDLTLAAPTLPIGCVTDVADDGRGTAILSADRAYRYVLTRWWGTGSHMVWVMLNPSTADAFTEDPTIRRCRTYARREGCGGLTVVNLFALRSTDPKALRAHPDPVGPGNDAAILRGLWHSPALVVCGWGNKGTLHGRGSAVARMLTGLGVPMYCLAVTGNGQPAHPLYQPAAAPLLPWPSPRR